MDQRLEAFLEGLVQAQKTDDSGGDIFALVMLGLVVLFFLWLTVAVVRKMLGKNRNRFGEMKEDEAEAARTARLWAEAKRKTEAGEEEEEEEEEQEPEEAHGADLQAELMEMAQQRREQHRVENEAARKARQETLRTETQPTGEPLPDPQPEIESAPTPAPKPEPQPDPQPEPLKEPEPPAKPAPAADAEPKSLEEGLKKTRTGFVSRLTGMFGRKSLDEDELDEIEEILFTADIGVRTAQKLLDFIQSELDRKDQADPDRLLGALKEKIKSLLAIDAPPLDLTAHKPFVILVVGVNGTGKTTTIGKLAQRYSQEGHKVVLAAGDTFRAAAAEQLQVWGERTGVQVIRGQDGGDPGAVVYDAISAAKGQGADVVIADTAGRLHTKINLVEELRKVHRVCGKAEQGAPHEVLLVLDATTGQNAINQAKQFHKALDVSGIVLTKLDGTAKGGVIIGITDSFGIPVRYIGIGEAAGDLRPFEPENFVKALFT